MRLQELSKAEQQAYGRTTYTPGSLDSQDHALTTHPCWFMQFMTAYTEGKHQRFLCRWYVIIL